MYTASDVSSVDKTLKALTKRLRTNLSVWEATNKNVEFVVRCCSMAACCTWLRSAWHWGCLLQRGDRRCLLCQHSNTLILLEAKDVFGPHTHTHKHRYTYTSWHSSAIMYHVSLSFPASRSPSRSSLVALSLPQCWHWCRSLRHDFNLTSLAHVAPSSRCIQSI